MKQWQSLVLVFSSIFCVAFNAQANIPLVASGTYTNSDAQYFPMLARSVDGATWDYGIDSKHLPTLFVNDSENRFTETSCTTDVCVSVGKYLSGMPLARTYYPMLAVSVDQGENWEYALDSSDTVEDFSANGRLEDVSCAAQVCVVVGSYENKVLQYPLLVVSQDNGATWEYKIDSREVPKDLVDGYFYNVSCTADICVAGGTYFNGVTNFALLAMSVDNGVTWEYVIDSKTVPDDFAAYSAIEDVSCSSDMCMAVGTYESQNTQSHYPMVITTHNNGEDWEYQSVGAPDDRVGNAVFTSSSCSTGSCIAAGYYATERGYYPMLASSVDKGVTWTYGVDSQNSPADFSNMGLFVGASCTQNICIAGGYYFTDMASLPMIVMSTDLGATWTYVEQTLPGGSNLAMLNGVACQDTTCIAGGEYKVRNGDGTTSVYPLLSVSTDNGATWDYQINGEQYLPDDFSSFGAFYGVGG